MQHAMSMPYAGTSLTATNQQISTAADVPGAIGCTSDDSNFVCLFQSGADAAVSFAVGAQGQTQLARNFTLARNTNIGSPWPEQYSAIEGQNSNRAPVPVIGADHSVIIADSNWVKRLTQTGVQVWPAPSTPVGTGDVGLQLGYQTGTKHMRNVLGTTPIQWGDETAIAVTFNDGSSTGTRTLSNIAVFRASDGSFIAKYPSTTTDSSTQGFQITDGNGVVHSFQAISPPTSHGNSLYYVGYESATNLGVLARFDFAGGRLQPDHQPVVPDFVRLLWRSDGCQPGICGRRAIHQLPLQRGGAACAGSVPGHAAAAGLQPGGRWTANHRRSPDFVVSRPVGMQLGVRAQYDG